MHSCFDAEYAVRDNGAAMGATAAGDGASSRNGKHMVFDVEIMGQMTCCDFYPDVLLAGQLIIEQLRFPPT